MWSVVRKIWNLVYLLPIILVGCQVEDDFATIPEKEFVKNYIKASHSNPYLQPVVKNRTTTKNSLISKASHFRDVNLFALENGIITPTECRTTELSILQMKYFTELAGDQLAVANFNFYKNLNYSAVLLEIGTDYFGAEGQYTHLVKKTKQDLERFWNMPDEISVRGQHTATLNDPEMLTEILWHLIADIDSKEALQPEIEQILNNNLESPLLPESPFFASDVLSRFDKLIILGDGLIEMFIETGISEEVAWTGILAHEWAHQIQINHIFSWYPVNDFQTIAERTRYIELEADFFSAYYLTHKRGATFNWKKVEDFFRLFFQAGDCSFDFELHHGTPLQRMQAAKEGYTLAHSMQKKGHILSPEEVHLYFSEVAIPRILSEENNL